MLQMRLYENLPQDAMCIREKVFMEEQGFCQEFDEIDEIALHGLLYEDETAVATARLYFDEKDNWEKVFESSFEDSESGLSYKLIDYYNNSVKE